MGAAVTSFELQDFPQLHPSLPSARAVYRAPPSSNSCRSAAAAAAHSLELAEVQREAARAPDRTAIRIGLPSKGRMADETLNLLKNCQLMVRQVNPRQYVADIPQLSNLEVWFQRPKDIVRKLQSGHLDLGIVGFDTASEYGQIGGSGVLVSPLTYIFEETPRWQSLLSQLGL